MTLLAIGFILGGLIGGGAVWLYARYQTTLLMDERNALIGRLRAFLALADTGRLTTDHEDVGRMLIETQAMIAEGSAVEEPPTDTPRPEPEVPEPEIRAQQVPEQDDVEEDLPGLFDRTPRATENRTEADRAQADRAEQIER